MHGTSNLNPTYIEVTAPVTRDGNQLFVGAREIHVQAFAGKSDAGP